jgi:hypothetical protein
MELARWHHRPLDPLPETTATAPSTADDELQPQPAPRAQMWGVPSHRVACLWHPPPHLSRGRCHPCEPRLASKRLGHRCVRCPPSHPSCASPAPTSMRPNPAPIAPSLPSWGLTGLLAGPSSDGEGGMEGEVWWQRLGLGTLEPPWGRVTWVCWGVACLDLGYIIVRWKPQMISFEKIKHDMFLNGHILISPTKAICWYQIWTFTYALLWPFEFYQIVLTLGRIFSCSHNWDHTHTTYIC